MTNPNERQGDLILAQGTYTLVQDGASGQVDVIVGPHKASLADTDKPVIYDHNTKRFTRIGVASDAIQTNPTANEGQYIILTNPSKENDGKNHPSKGKHPANALAVGHKINIPGPYTMPLYPGQVAQVLDGHLLKSNEYLLCRVYNEDVAKANLNDAVIKPNSGAEQQKSNKKELIKTEELVIGKLFVIKGTDVSFYIPPSGIEVIKDETGGYVRKAVTLERLEYCILLDQNGDKRFVQGPDVVFPKPTEEFIQQSGNNKFKAIELNDNMGIYVKVIADYTDTDGRSSGTGTGEGQSRPNGGTGVSHKSGDELFITGKDQKIYFPRPEHAIIKYGDQMIHYATAVPAGEARYILNKDTGAVEMVHGPKMLLADPRTSVIVKRALDEKTVALWFPGNREAVEYNRSIRNTFSLEEPMTAEFSNDLHSRVMKNTVRFAAVADELQRSSTYSKPRTITLDTKYEGAVRINVWPGYAIQVVKKTGERELIEGPKVKLLEYDEELEILSLSTGKPKSDKDLMKTTYLQKDNNVVSDIIEAETKDSVEVSVRLSYRVNFDPEMKSKWFSVSDYVKLLCQHMRSLIRNKVKKTSIEEFSSNATDIIRDLILGGAGEDGKRVGRKFAENGMYVYDIEVLKIGIGDAEIENMLKDSQQSTVAHKLRLMQKQQDFEYVKELEGIEQKSIDIKLGTIKKRQELRLTEIHNGNEVKEVETDSKAKLDKKAYENEKAVQEFINFVEEQALTRQRAKEEAGISYEKQISEIRVAEHERRMKALQPGLIEAITTMSNNQFVETLAKNLQHRNNGFGQVFAGGFDGILELVKGSPLEDKIKKLVDSKATIHEGSDK